MPQTQLTDSAATMHVNWQVKDEITSNVPMSSEIPHDEDRFEMHNVQVLSTVMKEEETCYHSEQVPMTTVRYE